MAPRRVRHHHLMAFVGVLEEVVDALFFHHARYEVKVGFAVLDTVITRVKGPLGFIHNIESLEDLFQNVRNTQMLENSALCSAGEEPQLRHDFHAVRSEDVVLFSLTEATANTIEVPFFPCWQINSDRDLLAQELVKGDIRGIFSQ